MILPNTLKLFCISTSLSEINDLEESIISSTPLNEKFNDAKALFESDASERANTQSFNNLRTDSNNKIETKKKVKFMVNLLKKKKGRKGNEDAKREIHDSKTYDNIIYIANMYYWHDSEITSLTPDPLIKKKHDYLSDM